MPEPPVCGLNIWDPATKADPYPHYEELRAAGRVVSNMFLAGQFMVPGYDDVLSVLSDPATFCSSKLGTAPQALFAAPTMLTADPPDHERLRGAVARAFTPRSITGLETHMGAVARRLVEPLADGAAYDVVAGIAQELPVLVIAELLGVGTDDLDDFVAWSHGLLGVLDIFAPADKHEAALASSKALHDYFAAGVTRRRSGPATTDLVGRLVAANEDERVSEDELLSSCVLLLLGGNETTTRLIANAVLALWRHPEERSRLADDDALLATAVEEVLRFDTPVQGNGRITTCDTTLAGYDIPAGSLVVGLLAAANRDPAKFDDPARFDVGRDPNPHLAFGRGIHHCLGANLARLEARAALRALLAVAPTYELRTTDLEYGPTFFFHSPEELVIQRG